MVTFFNVFSYTFFKIQKPAWLQYLFQVLTCLPLNLVRTEHDSRDSVTRFSTHGLVLCRPAWHTVKSYVMQPNQKIEIPQHFYAEQFLVNVKINVKFAIFIYIYEYACNTVIMFQIKKVKRHNFLLFCLSQGENGSIKGDFWTHWILNPNCSTFCKQFLLLSSIDEYDVLSFLKLGVLKNLHVLLWKIINDTDNIRSQQFQNGN